MNNEIDYDILNNIIRDADIPAIKKYLFQCYEINDIQYIISGLIDAEKITKGLVLCAEDYYHEVIDFFIDNGMVFNVSDKFLHEHGMIREEYEMFNNKDKREMFISYLQWMY
jgi:hypothetical protein